jgi:hypothetical protein
MTAQHRRAARREQQAADVRFAPVAISDATSFEALGINGRQFRTWLREAGVPHKRIGRRTVALVEHVRAALGGDARVAPAFDRAALIARAAGGGR